MDIPFIGTMIHVKNVFLPRFQVTKKKVFQMAKTHAWLSESVISLLLDARTFCTIGTFYRISQNWHL